MATAVQIELSVDEKGAVQGVRSFDTAIKSTKASVVQLNSELARTNATSAAGAGGALKSLEKEFTGGESSLRTMNAEVRSLQGSIYGDSRAAAEFLAIWPKVGAAMELAFPIFGAVALVGVLVQAGEKVHELYDKYLSLSSAARDYNAEAAKAKEEDFGNSHSIETTIARIKEATEEARKYQQQAAAITGKTTLGDWIAGNAFRQRQAAHVDLDKSYKARGEVDKLTPKGFEQQHEATLDAIRIGHGSSEHLSREREITQEYERQVALNQENVKYEFQLDKAKGNTAKFPQSELDRKNKIAQMQEEQQRSDLRREQEHQIMQLQNEATNAELRGVTLLEAQRKQAIAELKFNGIAAADAIAAVNRKYHAEEKKFLQDELNATQLIQARAAAAGMTGIEKIQAEGDIQIGQVRGSNLSGDAKEARIAAAKQQTNAQILQAQRQFTNQIDSLVDQSADRQIQGFARIRTEEAKQLDDLKKKFDETYGHMDMSKEGATGIYANGHSDYDRGKAAIHKSTADQVAELSRRNAEETEDIEAQARIRYFSAEKNKTAAIEAEYQERTQKLQEQLEQGSILWGDYNRRLVAAGQERDAELVQAATAAREKMSRQFESVFRGLDHPLKELQDLGEKAAADAAATMVQKYQSRRNGGTGAAPSVEGLGGIFGGLFGHHTGHASPDRKAEIPGRENSASSSVFSVSTALIHVGSAQIAFGGASGTTSGGYSPASFTLPTGFSGSSFSGGSSFLSSSFSGSVGGAGSAGGAQAPAHTSGGVVPAHGGGVGSVLGDLQQGVGLSESAMSIFKRSGSSTNGLQPTDVDIPNGTLNADGSYTNAGSGGMLQGGGFKANAMGAAGGAMGLFGAYEGNGGAGGALGGAMSGMQLGMALGGPVGAAVGAAAGAIFGAIGFGGREKAHVYDLKNVRPRIQTDQLAYNAGSMDYMSAYSDMQSLDLEAKKTTDSMGPAAKSYYKDTIEREIHEAAQRFSREEKAGRSMYTATAAQYATGVDRVPHDGFAYIHKDERVVPSDENRQITRALNLHTSYQAAMQRGSASMAMMTRGDTHLHFHAHDSKTAMQFFMANKHMVRSALDASYGENSGGADA